MDNYIVSARKYRPATFRSVVGQKALTQTLKNAIDHQKLAHAYLFCGPRGVGKTTCARIFAKTINCEHPTPDGEACNACESCRAFNEQRSYNISELDAASNNSIENIRQLIDLVRIPPQIGRYKVFIIDEVHMLSTAAFNAFLKTLEEPPHHAIFILATTEKHKILPTILSRCQIYDFARISLADTVEHLQYVAAQEGVQAEPEALGVIAQKAEGGMRDALSIFDQIVSYAGGNITYASVIANLNVLDYDYYFRLIDACLQGTVPQALLLFDEVLRNGFEASHFVGGLSAHLRDLLVSKDEATLPLLEAAPSVTERYRAQAAACETPFLYKALEICNECDLNYRISKNRRLLVELMLIRLAQLSGGENAGDEKKNPVIRKIEPQSQDKQSVAGSETAGRPKMPPGAAHVTPAAPSPSPVAPEPAAVAVKRQPGPSAPTPQQAAPPKPKPAPGAPVRSISIRKPLPKDETSVSAETSRPAEQTPFTQEMLQEAWLRFAETIASEAVLYNTMRSSLPVLLQDETFEVVVDNKDQLYRLNEKSTDLLVFLRRELANGKIVMYPRESRQHERVRVFSQREKFDFMAAQNKELLLLKERFNLELA